MPELPEVESLVRGLRDELIGKSFISVRFFRKDIREKIPQARLKSILLNQSVEEVLRRGKYILIGTDEGFLGIHLGMSGRFVRSARQDERVIHTHAVFTTNDEHEYRFIDPRRFGRLFDVKRGQLDVHPFLASLGVEPLDDNVDLARHLYERSRRKKLPIKNFLMDSRVVVGVGNIYASEALWRAQIHPESSACKIDQQEFVSLAREVQQVLIEAISAGGTTFRDYRDKDGNPGYFQKNLAVYGKESKACKRCGHSISRNVQSGRSTFFCRFCQKAKKSKLSK